jgi:general secretion pathway protein C
MFSTAPAASPTAASKPTAPTANTAIRQREPGSYDVDRSFVDGLLEKQGELLRSVHAKPESVGGKIIGLRIESLRPDSPLAALGVASGDRLESVNGFHLGSPTEILEAYAKLRVADRLRLAVTRQGRPVTLEYNVK